MFNLFKKSSQNSSNFTNHKADSQTSALVQKHMKIDFSKFTTTQLLKLVKSNLSLSEFNYLITHNENFLEQIKKDASEFLTWYFLEDNIVDLLKNMEHLKCLDVKLVNKSLQQKKIHLDGFLYLLNNYKIDKQTMQTQSLLRYNYAKEEDGLSSSYSPYHKGNAYLRDVSNYNLNDPKILSNYKKVLDFITD